MTVEHTPAPWTYRAEAMSNGPPSEGPYYMFNVYAPDSECVAEVYPEDHPEGDANARRIVAAVNATDGIPTEALEQGIVQEMLEVLERLAPETNILGGLAADARAVLARIRGKETTQ